MIKGLDTVSRGWLEKTIDLVLLNPEDYNVNIKEVDTLAEKLKSEVDYTFGIFLDIKEVRSLLEERIRKLDL